MEILNDSPNLTPNGESSRPLSNEIDSKSWVLNPDNPVISSQSEKTSDNYCNNSSFVQESSYVWEDVKHDFDSFADEKGQIYRKYSLREVKPVTKPFQHKIKMRGKLVRSEKREEHPKDIEHLCKFCYRIFKTYTSYMNHLRQHSSTGNTYTCAQCEESFSTNKELWDHKMESHKEANCFLCQKCQLAFSDHYTYLLHTICHMKKPYQCPECQVKSINYKSMASHLRTHFNPLTKCHLCNKEVRQNRLQLHLKCHQDIFKCVECGKMCTDKTSYNCHLNCHTGVKPYQCLYCGKAYSTSSNLRVHTTIHTGVKPFQCNQCNRQFRQQADFKRHKEGHQSEGKYECDYCGKKFKVKASLKYHIRSHTNYKPYKCPNCKLSFTTLVHLRSHIKFFHLTTKEYICKICEVSFYSHNHYLRHLKCKRHLQNAFCTENAESPEGGK